LARVLVAEPSLPICAALKKFLESARHEVGVVHSVAEAIEAAREKEPQLVIASSSGTFDGEALCTRLKALRPLGPVVLVYPPDEDQPEARAARVGAEAFLVGPLKRAAVVGTIALVLRATGLLEDGRRLNLELAELKGRELPVKQRISALEDEAISLSAQVGKLKDQLKSAGAPGGEVAFLKRFLPLEVKRSRRYQYPVSVVLVGLDKMEQRLLESSSPEFQRATIRSEAMAGIFKVVRDIDLAVPFSDDKYLILLPHTPREGALVVASRLLAQLTTIAAFDGGSASAGVSAYEPRFWTKEHVSFGGLMREATTALLKAQADGGGRVEAVAIADRPKRDRISIG
jgi:PleD family two-component response regulator